MATYPPEIKAQVIAARLAGTSENALVKQFNVPKTTLRFWVKQAELHPKTKALAELDIDAIGMKLIDGSVSAVGAIAGVTLDPTWLRQQNAHDLAILYGVIADKLIRVLGAVKPRPEQRNDIPAEVPG